MKTRANPHETTFVAIDTTEVQMKRCFNVASMLLLVTLGFIPRRGNYFSCSYSETCRKALAEFYQEGRAQTRQQSTNLPVIANYTSQQPEVIFLSPLSYTHTPWFLCRLCS